jgi:hypothetical protein
MITTCSFTGSIQGKYRYTFYLFFRDYIQAEEEFEKYFDPLLERFARAMNADGAVIRPFIGDIENTRDQVLSKNWTKKELLQIKKLPGILIIDTDFDKFNPRENQWLHLSFGNHLYEPAKFMEEYDSLFTAFADVITNPDEDFFQAALPLLRDFKLAEFAEIVEIKPGIFGASVDLFKAATKLSKK